MPLPLPLQLSQSRRLDVLPVLRRALLCCMAAFIGMLLLWSLSAAWHSEAETGRNDARASVQKTAAQLSEAHETRLARSERAKRFDLVKAVLEN
ncbi:MAG: hypothetical protein LBE22_04215, partial [Azoarcus sp.]|nr:hypothetical protein [Azoarcus sp.]